MDTHDTSSLPSNLLNPLEQFRAPTRKLKLQQLEKLLLWIVSIHLIFMPWGIGSTREWAQWISLGCAAVGFVVALIPREYFEEHTGSGAFRLVMWPKLVKFPLFWLGLAMLAYVAIGACNYSWIFETDGKGWWMRSTNFVGWLPSAVRVPFARWGPWRMFIIYAAAWFTVCSVWVGLTRRRSVQALLIVVAANGLVLAGFGILQRFFSNGKIFWFFEPPPHSMHFASFIYKNHAGNYLNLTLAATCGIASWFYLRGLRRLEKSNPSGVFAFFATCIAVAILVSYARGATMAMLAFLCGYVGVFVLHQLVAKDTSRRPIVAIALAIIFGIFLKIGLDTLNSHEAWTRLKEGFEETDGSLETRRGARQAALDVLKENWVRGVGVGAFEFLFPDYTKRYPEILGTGDNRLLWDHAHDDLLEIPAEQGVAGLVIIFAAVGYLALLLVRGMFWQNPLAGCLVYGALLTLVQAWWDFPFVCPAVLLLWWTSLVLAAMWVRFEEINSRA